VTTTPNIKVSHPHPLIWTPAIEVQTFSAYQSATKKNPARTTSAIHPAAESCEFSFLSGTFICISAPSCLINGQCGKRIGFPIVAEPIPDLQIRQIVGGRSLIDFCGAALAIQVARGGVEIDGGPLDHLHRVQVVGMTIQDARAEAHRQPGIPAMEA